MHNQNFSQAMLILQINRTLRCVRETTVERNKTVAVIIVNDGSSSFNQIGTADLNSDRIFITSNTIHSCLTPSPLCPFNNG